MGRIVFGTSRLWGIVSGAKCPGENVRAVKSPDTVAVWRNSEHFTHSLWLWCTGWFRSTDDETSTGSSRASLVKVDTLRGGERRRMNCSHQLLVYIIVCIAGHRRVVHSRKLLTNILSTHFCSLWCSCAVFWIIAISHGNFCHILKCIWYNIIIL